MPVTKLEEPKEGQGIVYLWRYVVQTIRRINRPWRVTMKPFTGQVRIDESENAITLDFGLADFAGDADYPLKLVAGDAAGEGNVIYGTVAGMDVTPASTGVSDGDHAWVQVNVTFTDTTGLWSYDSVSLHFGASVPASTATEMFLNLGYFEVSGSAVIPHSALTGSQDAARCGNSDAWSDHFAVQ
jgi:hypothetical protein